MLKLIDNDFKAAIIIILNEVKQNMFLIKEKISGNTKLLCHPFHRTHLNFSIIVIKY